VIRRSIGGGDGSGIRAKVTAYEEFKELRGSAARLVIYMGMKSLQISDKSKRESKRSKRIRQLPKVSCHERDRMASVSPRSVIIQSN